METPFSTLPGNAKLWVYQASRDLTETDKEIITADTKRFIESWTAHQANLKAGFEILHNLFVVIAVDESFNNASGCSIDAKVNFVKGLGAKTGIDFFNRLRVAFIRDEHVEHAPINAILEELNNGSINQDVIVFNNMVTTVNEFQKSWKLPLKESWIQSMMPA